MDKIYKEQELKNCQTITQAIENLLPSAKVYDIGHSVMVMHANESISTIFPVTGTSVDFASKDFKNRNYDLHDLPIEKLIKILAGIDQLKPTQAEQSTSGQVAPVDATPNTGSFYREVNRFWKDGNKYPIGHESSSLNLNEGIATSRARMLYHSELHNYLKEMLPLNPDLVRMDFDGNIQVELGAGRIQITPQGANQFGVKTFVDHSQITETDKVSRGDLVQLVFELSEKYNSLKQKFALQSDDNDEDSFSVLKELAIETGKSDDFIRNPDLVDIGGIGVSSTTGSNDETDLDSFLQSVSSTPSHLRGNNVHAGHPVSLNEGRDISRPYADTLGGKVLRWIHGQGAVFVDKADLPPEKYLSNSPEGVVLVEGKENVNYQRPQWRGWSR